jgi:flavin-dependent dehydrogenase
MSDGTAIVVGAGIAGVIAARALADRFARVLVVDRDREVIPRPHVPQQPHTHVLGAHGYRLLCRQFEGFDADMEAAGAPLFDFGECPFFAGRWAPLGKFGLVSRSSTRPLIERVLRRQLAARPNVELVTGQRVTDFVLDAGRVTAVRFADGREAAAALVVDAAGVGSKTPEWLAKHGYPAPPRTEVDLHGGVMTQLFRPAARHKREWTIMNVRRSGDNHRHGVVSWVEDGLWRVSLWGIARARPPRKPDEFVAFARAMAPPLIAELLEGAEPVSPPAIYANAWSQWIHYERLPRFPDGLVVIGDATFHPNYEHGQGMTFCAMTAEVLADHVDRHGLGRAAAGRRSPGSRSLGGHASDGYSPGGPRGSSLRFQRDLGEQMAPWWDWNLSTELMVPGVAAAVPSSPATSAAAFASRADALAARADALRHRYYRWIRGAGLGDAALWKLVMEVNQAVRPPRDLLRPSALWRALHSRLRG